MISFFTIIPNIFKNLNYLFIFYSVELWKYVVTLSTQDEIILWSCETWKPLQKVQFVRPFTKLNPMKLTVDGTGRYIFLSDIDNNVC